MDHDVTARNCAHCATGAGSPVLTRRGFLVGAASASAATVTVAIAAAGLTATGLAGCVAAPTPQPTPSRWVRVDIEGMAQGSASWVVVAGSGDGTTQPVAPSHPPTTESGFWLVAQPGGTFLAFDPRCSHMRCLFDWNSQTTQFLCRCHGGVFGADGRVIGGPPPRPLGRYQVRQAGLNAVEVGWWDPGSLEPEPS